MFKKATGPILLTVLSFGFLIAARSYLAASINGRAYDEPVSAASWTYDTAHARLRSGPGWHVVDSYPATPCFWVTRKQRQAKELTHSLLFAERPRHSWADRRGVVRIEPVQGSSSWVSVDEQDTSYWRVVGDVYMAGDPALVREVAAYLLDDASH